MTSDNCKPDVSWIEENAGIIRLVMLAAGVVVAAIDLACKDDLMPVFTALMIAFWAVRILALALKLKRLEAELRELKESER